MRWGAGGARGALFPSNNSRVCGRGRECCTLCTLCTPRDRLPRRLYGDRPAETYPPGQLLPLWPALSCAVDKTHSRLEPCTRPSTCDNVSKLPAQTECGSSALGVALPARNRFDTALEQAIRREGLADSPRRSRNPLLGAFTNRSSHKLKDRNGGSNDHDKGTTGLLPAMRQEDRSRPGQVRQVLRNAATARLAAQAVLCRPERRSGTPPPARRPLRQSEGRSHQISPSLLASGRTRPAGSTSSQLDSSPVGDDHRLPACGWRRPRVFVGLPDARRAEGFPGVIVTRESPARGIPRS